MTRVAVVLGYSDRRGGELHPICATRLERALSAGLDAVVVSGTSDEIERMLAACDGTASRVVADGPARRTVDSASGALALARELGVAELVVVTSWWHRPRAVLLFRALFRGSGIRVTSISVGGPWSIRHLLRESACLPLVPLQLTLARRPRVREPRRR